MITPPPARNTIFNEEYPALGAYVTDNSRVPYFNPSDSDEMIQPGEPFLLQVGAGAEAVLANGPIFPNEISMVLRMFTGDFPAAISADLIAGTEIYWDITNQVAAIAGAVTNGFSLGFATWAIDPNNKNERPTVDANGRVIVAVSGDTVVRVVSDEGLATTKGTVVIRGAATVAATSKKASK